MSRPTDDKKEYFIGVRVNDDTKAFLDGQGSVSDYIRNLLDNVKQNGFVKQNTDNVKQNESNVKQNDDSFVKQLQERITELENDNAAKQERIAELEFLSTPNEDKPLANLSYDTEIELKDTLRMIELSSSKEQVPLFLKNLHDRLESGEFQIQDGKLKLGYSEVYEVINRAETKKWLKGVWDMCEEKGLDYKVGLRSVFEEGSKVVIRGMGSQQEANYVP